MILRHEVYKYDTVAEMSVLTEVKVRTKSKKSMQSPNRRGPARRQKGRAFPQRFSPRGSGLQAPWGARKTRRRCCRLAGRAHTGHAGASSSAPRTHLSPAVENLTLPQGLDLGVNFSLLAEQLGYDLSAAPGDTATCKCLDF